MERRQISRVLISVSDKNKLTDFAKKLDRLGIEIVSTGGTSKAIEENGIDVTPVESVTNFPEMMSGRVKTLHPLIFGGIVKTSLFPKVPKITSQATSKTAVSCGGSLQKSGVREFRTT